MTIYVTDWNSNPGLRYEDQSPSTSGELFYLDFLNPKFAECYEKNEKLTIVLDGTEGFASSFLDEAFGNLVYDFTKEVVVKNLIIVAEEEPYWVEMIKDQTFLQWENRRKNHDAPKRSISGKHWKKLETGVLLDCMETV